jgi:hypothetical protein
MSDGVRSPPVFQLVAIAILAAVFVACIGGDREVDGDRDGQHPLRIAQHRLRIGLTVQEAIAAINFGVPAALGGTMSHFHAFFADERTGDTLILNFEPEHTGRHRVYRSGELASGNVVFPAPRRLTDWRFDAGDRR